MEELYRSLGRIEGTLKALDEKMTDNMTRVNKLIELHDDRLDAVEKAQSNFLAKIGTLTATIALAVPVVWEVLKKKIGF